jgi:uncharacterized HAD superfamily protein
MGLDLDFEAHTWNWFEEWESRDEFMENLHESVDAGSMYWQGDLYEPGIGVEMRKLQDAGHTIHVVTARLFGRELCPKEATSYWFSNNDIPFDTLTVAKDKTIVPTDYFIEDNQRNYDALEAAGVQVYLINRPHNLENDSRRRVNTVKEFINLVLGRENASV